MKKSSNPWIQTRLVTDPLSARRIAPAEITPCPNTTEDYIRLHLAAAVRASKMAQVRLDTLASQSEASRLSKWETGPEQEWFFEYSDRKFRKLQREFGQITTILSSSKLKVICNPKLTDHGQASVGIRKIFLGSAWVVLSDRYRHEKIGTFIHEAAHIAGQTATPEWYEQSRARYMAAYTFPRPMRVTRNASNYEFYALDIVFDLDY